VKGGMRDRPERSANGGASNDNAEA